MKPRWEADRRGPGIVKLSGKQRGILATGAELSPLNPHLRELTLVRPDPVARPTTLFSLI
jgi:hypothetical protein